MDLDKVSFDNRLTRIFFSLAQETDQNQLNYLKRLLWKFLPIGSPALFSVSFLFQPNNTDDMEDNDKKKEKSFDLKVELYIRGRGSRRKGCVFWAARLSLGRAVCPSHVAVVVVAVVVVVAEHGFATSTLTSDLVFRCFATTHTSIYQKFVSSFCRASSQPTLQKVCCLLCLLGEK